MRHGPRLGSVPPVGGAEFPPETRAGRDHRLRRRKRGLAARAKHCPGEGFDLRDQHLVTTVNPLSVEDWHARFSAVERRYLFRLLMRRAPAVHDAGQVWQVSRELDIAAMQAGADRLIGRHDFTTFRSSICQAASPVKTLDAFAVSQVEGVSGPEARFELRARSFLHNQVRSFVGTLERVGAGAWSPDDVTAALQARNRAACGPVCPPQGLYLQSVGYPEDPFIA